MAEQYLQGLRYFGGAFTANILCALGELPHYRRVLLHDRGSYRLTGIANFIDQALNMIAKGE